MPFYEYHCDACGADFQVFVKTMDAPTPTCEACGAAKVSRKLSVFGVGASQPAPAPSGCAGCERGGSCPMSQMG